MHCGPRTALTGWTTTGDSARRRSTRSSEVFLHVYSQYCRILALMSFP